MNILKALALVSLSLFLVHCGNTASKDGNTTLSDASHDKVVQSFANVGSSISVVSGRLNNETPNFTDPNEQAMAQDLQSCVWTSPSKGNGSIGGAGCPISLVVTSGSTPTSASATLAYSVVDPAFQALNPLKSVDASIAASGSADSALNLSLNALINVVNTGTLSFSASAVRSATLPDGAFTGLAQFAARSSTASVSASANVTGHVVNGADVIDTETCTLDGSTVDCKKMGSPAKHLFNTRRLL